MAQQGRTVHNTPETCLVAIARDRDTDTPSPVTPADYQPDRNSPHGDEAIKPPPEEDEEDLSC